MRRHIQVGFATTWDPANVHRDPGDLAVGELALAV